MHAGKRFDIYYLLTDLGRFINQVAVVANPVDDRNEIFHKTWYLTLEHRHSIPHHVFVVDVRLERLMDNCWGERRVMIMVMKGDLRGSNFLINP